MENSFQTSFIPKKSIIETPGVRSSGSSKSLLTIIAVLILIIVGVAGGGLFLYKNYLTNQRAILSASIVKVGNNFDKDTITELQLFNKRMSASKMILDSHIVFSPLFTALGTVTIPSVQYTKFSESTTDTSFNVSMSGIALDYKSVAIQSDVFNSPQGRYFKNVVFSNLVRDNTTNYVSFDVNFTVDPSLLSYEKNNLLEQSSQAQTPVVTTPTSTETTVTTPVTTASPSPANTPTQ